MEWRPRLATLLVLLVAGSSAMLSSQGRGSGRPPQLSPYLAAPNQITAIKAGRMFNAKAGSMLPNQVILIKGDRISDVGPSVHIPAEARVIDLSSATVLPGMIDTHIHMNGNSGNESYEKRTMSAVSVARRILEAGFTTVIDLDSRGGFETVEQRNSINSGLTQGPRMQVTGVSVNQRGAGPVPNLTPGFYTGHTEEKDANSPWLMRAAVRERKLHGVDWIKVFTNQDFVGQNSLWNADDTLNIYPQLTSGEVKATVDESHRLGLKVACHAYGGQGLVDCIEAGADLVAHGNDTFQNETAYRLLVQKKQPLFITITDIVGQMQTGDIQRTGGRNSRAMMAEKTFKKLLAAGVPLPFSSGASGDGDNGFQANEFPYMVKWGMTPVQALQSAFMMAASLLNYNWADRVGSIEKGKFADVIAVSGNPLTDISEMQRVKFVMKGGVTVRNDLSEAASTASAAW